MSQNLIESITSRINGILESVEREKAELRQKQAEAQTAACEARTRMEAAIASADAAAYHTAKQDEAVAATNVEMYNQRLSQISGKHLVPDEENANIVAVIRAEQKKLEKATAEQVIALIREIEELGKDYYEQQNALDELVIQWHRKVYKQPHPRISRLEADVADLRYNDTDLRMCISNVVTNFFYRQKMGRGSYNGRGDIFK